MDTIDYFAELADELSSRAARITRGFRSHRPSSGQNKELVVAQFLRDYMPPAFSVDTGLMISRTGEFSNQADVIIVDHLYNRPFYPDSVNRIWPIEAVYALIEVKSGLHPADIRDAIQKCRRFKTMPRMFADTAGGPTIPQSLFTLWAFTGPKPTTAKANIIAALQDVPRNEQPDFIVVPNSLLATAGHYFEISKAGMADSSYRRNLVERGEDVDAILANGCEFLMMGNNALLAWFAWFASWLKRAGRRSADLHTYLGADRLLGGVI